MDTEVMFNPEKHGYEVCSHCNGYGSSLKEDPNICTKCNGYGIIKKSWDVSLIIEIVRDTIHYMRRQLETNQGTITNVSIIT